MCSFFCMPAVLGGSVIDLRKALTFILMGFGADFLAFHPFSSGVFQQRRIKNLYEFSENQ